MGACFAGGCRLTSADFQFLAGCEVWFDCEWDSFGGGVSRKSLSGKSLSRKSLSRKSLSRKSLSCKL